MKELQLDKTTEAAILKVLADIAKQVSDRFRKPYSNVCVELTQYSQDRSEIEWRIYSEATKEFGRGSTASEAFLDSASFLSTENYDDKIAKLKTEIAELENLKKLSFPDLQSVESNPKPAAEPAQV